MIIVRDTNAHQQEYRVVPSFKSLFHGNQIVWWCIKHREYYYGLKENIKMPGRSRELCSLQKNDYFDGTLWVKHIGV